MEKDLEIRIEEKYGESCLTERISETNIKTISIRQPKGFVEIFEINEDGSKKLVGKSNLVTYSGRETVLVRLFNQDNAALSPFPGRKDEFVCWFGVGSGGCNPGDPFDPIPPTNLDTSLETDVPLAAIGWDPTYADPRTGNDYKHPFDSIEYEQDTDNYDSWLIAKVTTTLSSGDAVNQQINECGLFTEATGLGGSTGPFHLYAKVTFPTILKTISRQLVFVWYIYS
jgi:hypothetical protein